MGAVAVGSGEFKGAFGAGTCVPRAVEEIDGEAGGDAGGATVSFAGLAAVDTGAEA